MNNEDAFVRDISTHLMDKFFPIIQFVDKDTRSMVFNNLRSYVYYEILPIVEAYNDR